MAVTAAQAWKEPIYVDVGQNNFWQVWAGMESNSFVVRTIPCCRSFDGYNKFIAADHVEFGPCG